MRVLWDKWRFYGLGEDEYRKCMDKVFAKNIYSLRRTNAIIIVTLLCSLVVPVFLDKNLAKTMFYIGTCAAAALLYLFVRCRYRRNNKEEKPNKSLIYTLISLSYANIILFGIYLGVWANPGMIAGTFLGILICALLLFYIPAVYHLCLTLCSMIAFTVIVVIFKSPATSKIDIPNVFFAGTVAMVVGWQIIMNRLSLTSLAGNMEDERNNYYDQSTVDELTQLKNRRDFTNTIQRSLTSYRQSDNFLCVAILDIDFFKSYNDHYGHPKGDECLRKIGKALKDLHNNMNIYAARIGGEEFALIWFQKDATETQNVASCVCDKIRGLNIRHEKSDAAPYVTVSVGINVVRCGVLYDIDTLYNLADKALYDAKKNGRNCAVINAYN
jgi:diguanylate cyclase (GGDEF)-like protein